VLLLWTLHGGIAAGLGFHMLAVTVLTLLFGWQFAIISVTLVLFGVTLNGDAGWSSFGWNALSMGLVPVSITRGLLHFSQRRLPPNYFIYIFVVAFLGGILSMAVVGLVTSLLLHLSGVYSWAVLQHDYLPIFLLLSFPEGFLAGMLMSIIVAYRPQWVSSFDDDFYLRGR